MPDEHSFAFYETTLYFIPILCVIWSPIIYLQKEYFQPFTIWVPLYIIRDFFFGNMFDASWFLGA